MRDRILRTWANLALVRVLLIGVACAPATDAPIMPRGTLFVGIDVSGSFQRAGRQDDALTFAAHYIHAHLAGAGELKQPRALFVGAIGGERPGEPQAFHPIHDFEGKGIAEIERDLREWFSPDDGLTDFNAFFRRAAALVKRQNLVLAPVTLVLLTDGVPDLGQNAAPDDPLARYKAIDLEPLEYLARNVTVRLLYPDPVVAVHWEKDVPRNRVRMWTVDAVVMEGWREQVVRGDAVAATTVAMTDTTAAVDSTGALPAVAASPAAASPAIARPVAQPELWRWIEDNVDYRVRRSVL